MVPPASLVFNDDGLAQFVAQRQGQHLVDASVPPPAAGGNHQAYGARRINGGAGMRRQGQAKRRPGCARPAAGAAGSTGILACRLVGLLSFMSNSLLASLGRGRPRPSNGGRAESPIATTANAKGHAHRPALVLAVLSHGGDIIRHAIAIIAPGRCEADLAIAHVTRQRRRVAPGRIAIPPPPGVSMRMAVPAFKVIPVTLPAIGRCCR